MSLSSSHTPNKKLQSQLKTIVQSFGKLIDHWLTTGQECSTIINKLHSTLLEYESINIVKESKTKTIFHDYFPIVLPSLIGLYIKTIEDCTIQLKYLIKLVPFIVLLTYIVLMSISSLKNDFAIFCNSFIS